MKIHIVQPGDTLAKLARKYRVDLGKLVEANSHVKSEEPLEAGMKIKIPTRGIKVSPNKEKAPKAEQVRQESEIQAEPAAVQANETDPALTDYQEPAANLENGESLPPQFHRHNHWGETDDADRSQSESAEDDSEFDFEFDSEFYRYPYATPNFFGFYGSYPILYSYFSPAQFQIYPAGWISPYLAPAYPATLMPQPFLAQPATFPFPQTYFDLNEWTPDWDEIE